MSLARRRRPQAARAVAEEGAGTIPSTPTPPNGSRKAPSLDSALFPLETTPLPSLRGADFKTTKTRGQSSGHWMTNDYSTFTACASLPIAPPPLSPERHCRFYTHPSRGNRHGSISALSEISAPFFLLFRTILQYHFPPSGGGGRGGG